MKFQIALLRFFAIASDLVALAYFFMPAQMSGLLGIQLTQPSAIGDVRASYGGLIIGLAIFLWLCANPTHARTGVRLLLLAIVGLMTGRLFGILVDGPTNTAGLLLLGIEISTTIACLLALRANPAPAHLQTA